MKLLLFCTPAFDSVDNDNNLFGLVDDGLAGGPCYQHRIEAGTPLLQKKSLLHSLFTH